MMVLSVKSADATEQPTTINSNILFTSYNKPVTITAPTDSKSLQDIMMGIFGGMQDPAMPAVVAPKK